MSGSQRYFCLFAAALAAYGYQAPAAPPPAAKGSIEGQVVNATTGAPLKRATIRVVAVMPPVQANASQPQRPVMINKETDEHGRFSIPNLDPGKYRVTAERQGFLRQSWGAHKYSGGSTPIAVAEGQTVKSIDFRLLPQGVITGKVLDEDGEPIAGVQVRAQRAFMRNGRKEWNVIGNATTSDIGEYRLPELKAGRYVVVASPRMNQANLNAAPEALPEKPEMTYTATYYPSTADAATAVPVDVGEGGEVPHIDIRLTKAQVFRVRGRVTGMPGDASRRGMVQVILTPRDGPRDRVLMGQARAPEGTFEIRNVPPGQYLAHAQVMGGGQQQFVAIAPVDVIGGHVDGVSLALGGGGDVSGSVKVVDAPVAPDLKNLQVSLRPVAFNGQAIRSRVGDDLKFILKGVPAIRYTVAVSGYPNTCYVKSIQYGGADLTPDGAEMASGAPISIVISGAAAQVDLVITAAQDKAAGGAQVMVMREGEIDSVRSADENGILSLRGLKPGSYRLIAWEDVDSEQLWDPDYVRKFENDGKTLKLDENAHEAVQLKAIPAQ